MKKWLWLALCLSPAVSFAHVGSPEVYYDTQAGPYHLLVTIRPPNVIPGIAEIEIRNATPGLRELRLVPLRIVGPGADLAPTPDVATQAPGDPRLYTGKLWIMLRGAWQIRIQADGTQGRGESSVPFTAVASMSLPMQRTLGALLLGLGLFLSLGIISIIAAAAREAKLEPEAAPGAPEQQRSHRAMVIGGAIVVACIVFGNRWWSSEATAYAEAVYKLPRLQVTLAADHQLRVQPQLSFTGRGPIPWVDLIPDHGHLVHLFLVRVPELDRLLHLHPQPGDGLAYVQKLPSIDPGRYQVFADIVHHSGFSETAVGEIDLPAILADPAQDDDSVASAPPIQISAQTIASPLPDGGRMVWNIDRGASGTPTAALKAREPLWFRFQVQDQSGQPVHDLEPYMGMACHAVVMSLDLGVFAHVHPAGSVAMAALNLVGKPGPARDPMSLMHHESILYSEAAFPYGFPKAGHYRIFVQVKRAGKIQTGVFETDVQ